MDLSRRGEISSQYPFQSNHASSVATPYPQHLYNSQPHYPSYHYYPSEPANVGTDRSPLPSRLEIPPTHYQASASGSHHVLGNDAAYVSHSNAAADSQPVSYSYPHHVMPTSNFYQDSDSQAWAAKEAIRHYGTHPVAYASTSNAPNGTEMFTTSNSNVIWNKTVYHPTSYRNLKRTKKTKIVQSMWCEICNIDCSSKQVLDEHKLGKKHKKNLEKLEASRTQNHVASTAQPDVSSNNPKESLSQGTKRKSALAAAPTDDLETKRHKLMEGGAAPEAVRVCEICNVACNSEKVYLYHLGGQKHASQLKKHTAAAGGTVAA